MRLLVFRGVCGGLVLVSKPDTPEFAPADDSLRMDIEDRSLYPDFPDDDAGFYFIDYDIIHVCGGYCRNGSLCDNYEGQFSNPLPICTGFQLNERLPFIDDYEKEMETTEAEEAEPEGMVFRVAKWNED